jgi:hypothetical protein
MFSRLVLSTILIFTFTAACCQREKYKAAREEGNEIFVITMDSVKHTGSKLKTPTAYPPPFVKLDGVKYSVTKPTEVLAYQDENEYVVNVPGITGLSSRFVKGKINLYTYVLQYWLNGRFEMGFRWLLEKERGVYLNATFESMEKVFGDNPAVMAKYNQYFPKIQNKSVYFSSNIRKEERIFRDQVLEMVELYNK